jgi:hypothetical protein
MNSITKRTTMTFVTSARNVHASNLLRASAHTLTLLLLLSGIPAISANKATDSKASKPAAPKQASDTKATAGAAGGEGWLQDKNKAEMLLHMADASNSVYLAAKLTTPEDIKAARQLLRKSAQELANQPSHPKQVIGAPLGKLIGDFAFLQSVASQPTTQSANSPPTEVQNLKDVCTDYDALIPAAEKQLGSSDVQVRGLKTLRTTINQSLNPQKHQKIK